MGLRGVFKAKRRVDLFLWRRAVVGGGGATREGGVERLSVVVAQTALRFFSLVQSSILVIPSR